MFDVFQNVLFGKKKSNADAEKEKSYSDDFVMIGQASNDPPPGREAEPNPSERLFPKSPFGESFLPDSTPETSPVKKEEVYHQIMPLQDVPFTLNSSLYASSKLDQIWKTIAQSISSIESSKSYQEDYDFSLEKSVISETANKCRTCNYHD
ncbi:UMA domain-containing protein [Trichonephila clavata]|uniref:UMA domain-containing protein n=1 Tax=Trichonephila clavata TaxID=2740835 RepID=A0A8X6KJY1_TRICU|nr:UMA domain-containing protein [Trichonephila clavata]